MNMVSHIGDNPREQSSANEKMGEGIREEASHHQQDIQIYESLERDIQNLKQLSSNACIFKVHEGLRRTNEDAYTPLLISIGPYHHRNSKLSKMEKLKLMYFKSFSQRGKGTSMKQCWEKLKDLKGSAESYYGDDIELEGDEFVKMLLLDGCFIVEFICRECPSDDDSKKEEKFDALFMPLGVKFQVLRDLLLLENQLPFFVLQQIYAMVFGDDKAAFLDVAKMTFECMLNQTKLIPLSDSNDIKHDGQEIKHSVQFVHILCSPQDQQDGESPSCHLCICWEQCQAFNTKTCDIPTATELQEAGVGIHPKKVGETKSTTLFDINFNHGKLEIPSFQISDSTETFFRNIIAYEQHVHSSDDKQHPKKYFTDYAQLKDNLINTEKDVILFRMNGVFINCLGDDKEVTDLFNSLCKGVVYSSYNGGFCYKGECDKLKQHYNKVCNVIMAKLRHDYFYTPWACRDFNRCSYISSFAHCCTDCYSST